MSAHTYVDGISVPQSPTAHPCERWQSRADRPYDELPAAVADAERVVAPLVDGDETRYHEPTETLLVVNDGVLETVLCADHSRMARLQ